jgi:DNA methylase/ParB-like nuclease domain
MGKTDKTETTKSLKSKEILSAPDRKLAIEYKSLASLLPYPGNPRKHDKRQVRQIARSIEAFGFNVPLLINAENHVVAGHGRLLASRLLNLTEVPTIRLEHLTEAQARAFTIADNRLNENSAWDHQLLGEQLKILADSDLDFDLEVTGFEIKEVDCFIENLTSATERVAKAADVIPDLHGRPLVTRAGDCWNLGRHRVYCGDARSDSAYTTLMQGRRAEMVFAGPPCQDPINACLTRFGAVHHTEFAMVSDPRNASQFAESLRTSLTNLANNSVDGALNFICVDWRHSPELLTAAQSVYTEFKDLCVWVKDKPEQGSLYRNQHQLVFVFKTGKKPHRNGVHRRPCGQYRSNVWNYRGVKSRSHGQGAEGLSNLHQTIKPVDMVADAILDCTRRGQLVLDRFLGNGTTLLAAEDTGRTCYGMELDPQHVDTTLRRWRKFTGQNILEESTGRSFDDIEEERNR